MYAHSLKHVCGYIWKFLHGGIRIRTGIPDHEATFGDEPMS